MLILLIISMVFFYSYLIIVRIKYGKAFSILNTAFLIPKNKELWFALFSWSYGLPIAIVSSDLTTTGLMFFAGVLICVVGITTDFRNNSMANKIHMGGATIGVFLAQLSIIFEHDIWWYSLISICIMWLIYTLGKKQLYMTNTYVYWGETWVISTVYLILLLKLLHWL